MSFPEDLVARLERIQGLTALVSDRIYPGGVPQEPALPALSFRVIAGEPNQRLAGNMAGSVSKVRLEVTTYGATLLSAYAVIEALRDGLEAEDENPNAGTLMGVTRQTWQDGYVPEVKSFVVVQQYSLYHQE